LFWFPAAERRLGSPVRACRGREALSAGARGAPDGSIVPVPSGAAHRHGFPEKPFPEMPFADLPRGRPRRRAGASHSPRPSRPPAARTRRPSSAVCIPANIAGLRRGTRGSAAVALVPFRGKQMA
jgi:hypothetical protein